MVSITYKWISYFAKLWLQDQLRDTAYSYIQYGIANTQSHYLNKDSLAFKIIDEALIMMI